MTNIIFDAAYIARQRKLLSGRAEHDPRIAKFLAALAEIERLRTGLFETTLELEERREIDRQNIENIRRVAGSYQE